MKINLKNYHITTTYTVLRHLALTYSACANRQDSNINCKRPESPEHHPVPNKHFDDSNKKFEHRWIKSTKASTLWQQSIALIRDMNKWLDYLALTSMSRASSGCDAPSFFLVDFIAHCHAPMVLTKWIGALWYHLEDTIFNRNNWCDNWMSRIMMSSCRCKPACLSWVKGKPDVSEEFNKWIEYCVVR